ncbi:hypothetical protein AYK61_26595 [Rhodococcus sp. SBT000017]|uniref:hypothetical protein n=1 Tax=Rhodococcus sp. SBT000017 TaxID=1803385 RepID=UPI000EF8DA69|nr:hypothetical protein [Rhodococcus sp. SBT000017]RMB69720.1 hypothetical protein AYK61_26595 [Rhodococcus sp. SBT000017]
MDNILLWVTAVGAVATAIATIGLVVVAHKTLGGAKDQLTLLREQAEQERRPYVVADIVPGLHGPGSTDLVLQNLGRSTARGVLVDIGQLSKRNDTDHISDPLRRYLRNPRTLVPGARHRVMWHDVGNPETGRAASGVSDTVPARITYTDDNGTEYSETNELGIEDMTSVSPVPTTGPRVLGSNSELADIDHALRAIAGHVGELRR